MSRLRKYLVLPPAGRAFVFSSLIMLPLIAVLLRTRGFARTKAMLERRQTRGRGPAGLTPRAMARLVDAPAALLRIGCLPRSLLLWHGLRVRGFAAVIRMGVSRCPDGGLSAHAWVEHEGQPLNDEFDVLARFAVLPTIVAGH